MSGQHVRILTDNTTAVACINHMGTSHSDSCNDLTATIWHWWINHNVWLSAAHIHGKDITAADMESRKQNLDAEWQLNPSVLSGALSLLQAEPNIDLFG